MILCEWDAPEGHPRQYCVHLYPIVASHLSFSFLYLRSGQALNCCTERNPCDYDSFVEFDSIPTLSTPETQRLATHHDCLPGCWVTGTNKSEKACVEETNILCWDEQSNRGGTKIYCSGTTSPTHQPRKGPLSFVVLPESPFALVSTVKRGHPLWLTLLFSLSPLSRHT